MKEAQGVGLHDLRQPEYTAQLVGSRWNPHCEQGVARLGRRNEMANGTNATDTRHQRRHFRERPALAELFEPAKLRHVELRIVDPPFFIKVESNFCVSL